jgi:hypothetical protein
MSSENSGFLSKTDSDSRRTSDNEADNLQSNDKTAKILIYIQLGLVVMFMSLVITFFSFYFSAKGQTDCYFYSFTNETNDKGISIYYGNTTTNSNEYGIYPHTNHTNVKDDFRTLFITSGFVYLADVIARCFIVYGLCKRSIWFQIGGVVGTIIVSTFATTALLVLIPVYRYNAAGTACCTYKKTTTDDRSYCSYMTSMLWIMIFIWFLSCFTSFAINQNDF